MKLTKAQIASFHLEGYLVVENVFDEADLRPVIDEISESVDQNARELVARGELSQTYSEEPFETRLACITAETEAVYWAIYNGKLHGPGVFSLIANRKLLDVAESLLGPEIIASSVYRIRPKVPGFAHGLVPWHQDSGYFDPFCDDKLVLTVWIPLVDATPERGCLQVLPRAHDSGVVAHAQEAATGYLEIPSSALPPGHAVTTPVPRGGVLLLTNRTPHRSRDNVTDVVRWSADVRYQNASLPTNYESPSGWQNGDLPGDAPPACYPPEADFLVSSLRRPHDVVRDWHAFARLRERHEADYQHDMAWRSRWKEATY